MDAGGDGYRVGEDCDDADPGVGGETFWYIDSDGDGYGSLDLAVPACAPPEGFVANYEDCNDHEPAAWWGAAEVCDGADNDCDGAVDDIDADGDGDAPLDCGGLDCDDTDPARSGLLAEVCEDGIDNDCDGVDSVCHAAHMSIPFKPTNSTGQWCNTGAPVHWAYFGELTFDECQDLANGTGTRWYVGQYTSYLEGWIGDQDGVSMAASTSPTDWQNELIVSRTALRSCVLGLIEHQDEPTVSPPSETYTDPEGRGWLYWRVHGQTITQALAFADNYNARIINPNSVGLTGERYTTAPTHWCFASAEYNGFGYCNSYDVCDFVIGYWE